MEEWLIRSDLKPPGEYVVKSGCPERYPQAISGMTAVCGDRSADFERHPGR
jgi:hypothetical protein